MPSFSLPALQAGNEAVVLYNERESRKLLSFKQASTTNFFSKSVLESTLRMARCRNIKKHNETLSIIIGGLIPDGCSDFGWER